MSMERNLRRSMPFIPRYRSASASRGRSLGRNQLSQLTTTTTTTVRSRSQPSQKILYFEGKVGKYFAYPRAAHSPSPQRVIMLGTHKETPLTRMSHSGSCGDLHSSHVYGTLQCSVGPNGERAPDVEAAAVVMDARATSCGDIYHKGPFYPDASQSESGVSLNESQNSSFYGPNDHDDDNASQFSYGSSSAFHEITIDSELDRLDSEDGLKSPRDPNAGFRFRDPLSPDSTRSSPYPYTDARKRELMSSPSSEFDKTQSRYNALRVLIPTPDGSLAKERLARKDSGSGASTPLAQSTPHVSPRSFMGPKLSIKASWNVDEPYEGEEGVTANEAHSGAKRVDDSSCYYSYSSFSEDSEAAHATKRVDDSSCYSSFSEDNLSDVSPMKHGIKVSRKVKLTKKASDLPTKRSTASQLAFRGQSQSQHDKTFVSEESFENIHVPPLESVIGEGDESAEPPTTSDRRDGGDEKSWWAVYNIESADARRHEDEVQRTSPATNSTAEVKIVKPAQTGIPLISAGRHGQEKLMKRFSPLSSPPPGMCASSPKTPCPSDSDQSDESQNDVIAASSSSSCSDVTGREGEPLVKRECRERAEEVLNKTAQNLRISDTGAFNVVRASASSLEALSASDDLDGLETCTASSMNDDNAAIELSIKGTTTTEDIIGGSTQSQGEQLIEGGSTRVKNSTSYLPSFSTSSATFSDSETTEQKDNEKVDKVQQRQQQQQQQQQQLVVENSVFEHAQPQFPPQQAASTLTITCENQSLRMGPTDQSHEGFDGLPSQQLRHSVCDDVDNEADDGSDRTNKEAPGRHYALDNANTRGRGAEEEAAIFNALRIPFPDQENPQVVAEPRIAEVGGSEQQQRRRVDLVVVVGSTTGLQGESHLTSYTPGISTENNDSASSSSDASVAVVVERAADGFLPAENRVETVSSSDTITCARELELDAFCSEFSAVLTISDPDETLVQEEVNEEEVIPAIKEASAFTVASVYLDQKRDEKKEEEEEKEDYQSLDQNSAHDHKWKSTEASLTPSSRQENPIVNVQFEILSGNVGLEESQQTGHSSHDEEDIAKSSPYPVGHREEADSDMEWTFIDPRHGQSFREGRTYEVREVEEEIIEGRRYHNPPLVVSVLATAQLPRTRKRDDETHDGNQSCLFDNPPTNQKQTSSMQFSPPPHDSYGMFTDHQRFDNNTQKTTDDKTRDASFIQTSNINNNNSNDNVPLQIKLTRTFHGFGFPTAETAATATTATSRASEEVDGSIELLHPSRVVVQEGGNLRGDKVGIPQFEKTDAQNDYYPGGRDGEEEENKRKEEEERQWRREHEISSSSRSPAGRASAESRREDAEQGTALSQQVKHSIHRKTVVEETITIERSSFNESSSGPSIITTSGSSFEDCSDINSRVEKTVIREEDQTYTTTTTTTGGQDSCVSFVPPQVEEREEEKVSSDDIYTNRENLHYDTTTTTTTSSDCLEYSTHYNNYSPSQEAEVEADCPPLPSSPPPQLTLFVDTPVTDTTTTTILSAAPAPFACDDAHVQPPPPSSPHSHLDPDCADSHTSAMKWRDRVTTTSPSATYTSFDLSLDPDDIDIIGYNHNNDNNNNNTTTDPMAIVTVEERDDVKTASPIVTHRSALDRLHAQLSHISSEGDGFDVAPSSSSSSLPPPPSSSSHSHSHTPCVYHDHAKATTSSTTHGVAWRPPQGEATTAGNVNNSEHTTTTTTIIATTNTPTTCNGLDHSQHAAALLINNESGNPQQELYDNDYDNVKADQSKEEEQQQHSLRQQQQHHHLPKSGQMRASSLWTLKEETDSLLEAISPISSPKRHFSTASATVDERQEEFVVSVVNNDNNDNDDSDTPPSLVCESSQNENFNSLLYPFTSASSHARRTCVAGSESSDMDDESDGNYTSISTTDSSSYRSSSYGREQTPLSDSDNGGIAGDVVYADKMMKNELCRTSQSPGNAVDRVSSFNEFVNGLESERITSDWAHESHASVSNDEQLNQHQNAINFGGSPVSDADLPQVFKSSVAFCVSAAPSQSQAFPAHQDREISLESCGLQSSSSASIPLNASAGSHVVKQLFPATSRSGSVLPPFPVDENSLNNSSYASSSAQYPTDDVHSEASSRLYSLDLDLSRISSSCASPTPSDFSDGSAMFTSKGTAEIKRGHSVSFDDDYEMVPVSNWPMPTSTPKPLKSALKKPTTKVGDYDDSDHHHHHQQSKDSYHQTWVKQFDKILEDFNTKTSPLGQGSEVMVVEDDVPLPHADRRGSASVSAARGANFNDLYKAFTNDDSERKQNHVCPVVEDDNAGTLRFKRFLKKSHTKRSKGKRLIRFLSRLGCVSESVHSPDLSATRKMARLDNGQAYGTDFASPLPERICQPPPMPYSSLSPQHHQHHHHHTAIISHTKDSPTSSNHSLDSCPSRTDSAYSSVSESFSSSSPRHSSSRLPTRSFSSISGCGAPDGHFQRWDSPHHHQKFFSMDNSSAHSSTSDYASSLRSASETTDPFSPGPPQQHGKTYSNSNSKEMMTALSDVFDQLDVCEGEIDSALLNRLRHGHHQAVHFSDDA